MRSKYTILLFGVTYLASLVYAETPACSLPPYSSYLSLSTCSEAVSWCLSYYRSYCTISVTTTDTQYATTSSPVKTVTTTTTVTSDKPKNPTATVTSYSTVTKIVTKTTKVTETSVTAVPKRMIRARRAELEERQANSAACSSAYSKLRSAGPDVARTACPCIYGPQPCGTDYFGTQVTSTTTIPYTATRTVTSTITNKVTSDIKTVIKETVTKVTITETTTVTKVVETRPCKNVEKWPTYKHNGFCNGYHNLAGMYYDTDLTTCCLNCFNTFLCASFAMEGTTCNIFQDQQPNGTTTNPQCPYGLASVNAACSPFDPSDRYLARLGPCGIP